MRTANNKKNEVRYVIPKSVLDRFRIAAEIAGLSVNEFIKRYSLKCIMIESSKVDHHFAQSPHPKKAI